MLADRRGTEKNGGRDAKGRSSRRARVGVKGRIYTGFNFGGRNLGPGLEENDSGARRIDRAQR